eukprot:CAMPEP_0197493486 /NCGR_PEP_ID=MMETSP1311-20131121/22221_1 /TAXON_ID=464262 /ORGANISM="Genus nov. species nov., Strain RCC856" /LENGTH=149 /DNA_ID=CAMNT_0043038739 /DNA_START=109 /DNA_END=558 /DNA_ORIENTATION=+
MTTSAVRGVSRGPVSRPRTRKGVAVAGRAGARVRSPFPLQPARRASVVISRAASEDGGDGKTEEATSAKESSTYEWKEEFKEDRTLQEMKVKKILLKQQEEEEIKKGQRTAIFTGAISIFLGVAFLALQFLVDSRGNTLIPPPPEAMGL